MFSSWDVSLSTTQVFYPLNCTQIIQDEWEKFRLWSALAFLEWLCSGSDILSSVFVERENKLHHFLSSEIPWSASYLTPWSASYLQKVLEAILWSSVVYVWNTLALFLPYDLHFLWQLDLVCGPVSAYVPVKYRTFVLLLGGINGEYGMVNHRRKSSSTDNSRISHN